MKPKSFIVAESNDQNDYPDPKEGAPSSSHSSSKKMRSVSDIYANYNFYIIEPKNFDEAIKEKSWKRTMQEKIKMIEKNKTWLLVERPKEKDVIGVK